MLVYAGGVNWIVLVYGGGVNWIVLVYAGGVNWIVMGLHLCSWYLCLKWSRR